MEHDIFDEDRKQFQLERLILFSDAVFAIAITLLALDIRVPQSDWTKQIPAQQLSEYIIKIIPNIFGYIFSFFIIGFYWTIHHRIFGFVKNYDGIVIWMNMLMLCFIALLPFTTTLTAEYGYLSESFIFYWLNVGLIGILSYLIQLYISNPKKNLSLRFKNDRHRRYSLARALFTALVFFLGAGLAMTNVTALQYFSKYIYVLIFPGLFILKKIYGEKKSSPAHHKA